MLAIVYDFLLLLSIAAPPVIFGYLLYLGFQIPDHAEPEPSRRRGEQKHPRRLQP